MLEWKPALEQCCMYYLIFLKFYEVFITMIISRLQIKADLEMLSNLLKATE